MLKKLKQIYKCEGMDGILQRIESRVYIKVYSYKMDLQDIPDSYHPDIELVTLDLATLEEMYKRYRTEISAEKYSVLRNRVAITSSDTGFVVVDKDNRVYGFYHLAFKANHDTCVNYLVPDEPLNVHLFDDYTFEEKRGRGAHTFSIISRLKIAKELGYKTATVNIMDRNIYSERAYAKLGFVKCKEIKHYKLGIVKKTIVRELNYEYQGL